MNKPTVRGMDAEVKRPWTGLQRVGVSLSVSFDAHNQQETNTNKFSLEDHKARK